METINTLGEIIIVVIVWMVGVYVWGAVKYRN